MWSRTRFDRKRASLRRKNLTLDSAVLKVLAGFSCKSIMTFLNWRLTRLAQLLPQSFYCKGSYSQGVNHTKVRLGVKCQSSEGDQPYSQLQSSDPTNVPHSPCALSRLPHRSETKTDHDGRPSSWFHILFQRKLFVWGSSLQ